MQLPLPKAAETNETIVENQPEIARPLMVRP
jgi:hypothetical protein